MVEFLKQASEKGEDAKVREACKETLKRF